MSSYRRENQKALKIQFLILFFSIQTPLFNIIIKNEFKFYTTMIYILVFHIKEIKNVEFPNYATSQTSVYLITLQISTKKTDFSNY